MEELVLWAKADYTQRSRCALHELSFMWVCWAAGLERLRLMELRECGGVPLEDTHVLCSAARGEGEGVHPMLARMTNDLVRVLVGTDPR